MNLWRMLKARSSAIMPWGSTFLYLLSEIMYSLSSSPPPPPPPSSQPFPLEVGLAMNQSSTKGLTKFYDQMLTLSSVLTIKGRIIRPLTNCESKIQQFKKHQMEVISTWQSVTQEISFIIMVKTKKCMVMEGYKHLSCLTTTIKGFLLALLWLPSRLLKRT